METINQNQTVDEKEIIAATTSEKPKTFGQYAIAAMAAPLIGLSFGAKVMFLLRSLFSLMWLGVIVMALISFNSETMPESSRNMVQWAIFLTVLLLMESKKAYTLGLSGMEGLIDIVASFFVAVVIVIMMIVTNAPTLIPYVDIPFIEIMTDKQLYNVFNTDFTYMLLVFVAIDVGLNGFLTILAGKRGFITESGGGSQTAEVSG